MYQEDTLDRLKKIEGQVRGLSRMVESERYCVDILTQLAAVRAALDQVGMQVLEHHTRTCVSRAIKEDRGEPAVKELMEVVSKFVR